MNNENISIVGGSGFVGSFLTKRFKEQNIDYTVYDISANSLSSNEVYLDIEDFDTLEKIKNTSCIINLAAIHRDDVKPISRYDDVNVDGAKKICALATKKGINRIIFTSSVAIYGFAPPNTDESGDPNYFNDYGRTKYAAEKVYIDWFNSDPDSRTLVIIRPTVIFGEGNRGNVYNLLKQINSKRFLMVGDGKNKKSMAYVENVAAFIEYSLSFKNGLHIFNYIDKPDLDMNELVSIVRKKLFNKTGVGFRLPAFVGFFIGYIADFFNNVFKISLPISSIRVKKFLGTTQFSSSKKTEFYPPISLKDGLEKTLQYEFLDDNSDKRTFETE